MHVTLWGEYGIHCCTFLSELYPSRCSAAHIAEALGIELAYTHQILHRLRQGGVVDSSRGPRGGYGLARAPEAITIRDVVMATEGDTFRLVCEHKPILERCSSPHRCGLQEVWSELRSAIDAVLEHHSIASLSGRTPVGEGALVQIGPTARESLKKEQERGDK